MGQTIRCSLPGYNCLTDTNLDHYSLYADVDNVLIKEFTKGSAVISDGSPTELDISHNLNYIPFYMVYYDGLIGDGSWSIMNNRYNTFSVPDALCSTTTTDLKIENFGGHGGSINVSYDIFYDDMSQSGTPSMTESPQVLKVARPTKDISSTNPNDYIMHSDLNNFKILKQGTVNMTLNAGGIVTPNSFAHGATITAPYKCFLFVEDKDGKTMCCGGSCETISWGETYSLQFTIDGTNINIYMFNRGDSTVNANITYIIYGSGADSTVSSTGYELAVSKSGKDVLSATNPDDFNFHSSYATLKYFSNGSNLISSVSSTTVHTVAHNLGYSPFFIGFVNDISGFFSTSSYAIAPYILSHSTIPSPNNNLGAFVYIDHSNIYFKAWFDSGWSGGSKSFQFYYKIFKNNLGL
jgi:hypothetical protein